MNKGNGGLFHKGAYLDALRRLLFPAAVLLVFILGLDIAANLRSGIYRFHPLEWRRLLISFQMATSPLVGVFLGVSPMLLLYLFSHQMKRSGSDVFYSLPVKPQSRMFSSALAVLSVDAVMIFAVGILVELMNLIIPLIDSEDNSFWTVCGNYFAASLFTTAIMIIALALGGKTVSVILMFVTVFIVPRAVIFVGVNLVSYSNNTLPDGLEGSIFDDRLNTALNLITGYLERDAYDAIKSPKSMLYTFIVGVIYFAVGVWLYGKRRSETAQKAAVSSKTEAFFRIMAACGVSLFPMYLIIEPSLRRFGRWDISAIVWGCVLTIAVYFLYELINTRSIKKCLRAVPAFLIVVFFDLAFMTAVSYADEGLKNNIPSASDIESVKVTFYSKDHYRFSDDEDFYYNAMKDYVIKDKEAIGILCEALKKSSDEEKRFYGPADVFMVHFNSGLFFNDRLVCMDNDEKDRFFNILAKDPAYRDIFVKAVSLDEIDVITGVENRGGERLSGSRDELYAMYLKRQQEYEKRNFPTLVSYKCSMFADADGPLMFIRLKNGQRFVANLGDESLLWGDVSTAE